MKKLKKFIRKRKLMILYATKQTIKELNIPMPEELSSFNQLLSTKVIEQQKNNKLLEWGIKIFYLMEENAYRQ